MFPNVFYVTDSINMSRICRYYHDIPRDEDKCSKGHFLCATLDCQVKNCKFTTSLYSIHDIKPAIEIMKLHMKGAYPTFRKVLESSCSAVRSVAKGF